MREAIRRQRARFCDDEMLGPFGELHLRGVTTAAWLSSQTQFCMQCKFSVTNRLYDQQWSLSRPFDLKSAKSLSVVAPAATPLPVRTIKLAMSPVVDIAAAPSGPDGIVTSSFSDTPGARLAESPRNLASIRSRCFHLICDDISYYAPGIASRQFSLDRYK